MKRTKEQFIEEANKKHNNFYEYKIDVDGHYGDY